MAYNNYFPNSYNPYAFQPVLEPYASVQPYQQANGQQRQNQPQNSLIWVQGEAGAKAYPVAPNTTIQLWDSESQVVYLKSADASGMPSMKVLDYTIRDSGGQNPVMQKQVDLSGYITREEFEKRLAEVTHEQSII